MHQDHPSHKADALTVTYFLVDDGVGVEDSSQRDLSAMLEGAGKVRMGGKGPPWRGGGEDERSCDYTGAALWIM